jgi:hypothetical protein
MTTLRKWAWISQVTGDVVTRRPERLYLRYPPSLLNESTTPPYFPTVVDHAASAC